MTEATEAITGEASPAQIVADLRAAYEAGITRSLDWRRYQLSSLIHLLEAHEDELSAALEADLGKPAMESALTEFSMVIADAKLLRKKMRRWLKPKRVATPLALWPASARIVREPKGVVLVMGPWNYPVQLVLAPLAGALAAGNTVLIKPSELAPATAETLARLLPQYLDARAVAVVQGGPEVATAVLAERYDHILYTGGGAVARIVARAAAEHLTPTTLELGGKSPVWVDDSVNLEAVADRLVWGKFLNAGQTCIAPDYVLATPQVADRLVPLLRQSIARRFSDNPIASTDYGRILDATKFDRLDALLDDAVAGGAEIAVGGERDRSERFIAPTVLDGVDLESQIMQEEIFGPILPIVRVADAETAIELINAGQKPLALYVFSGQRRVRDAFAARTSSGALGFNIPVAHIAVPGLPFGGVGESGMGAYHAEHSIRTFSHERAVLRKPLWPDTMRLVYPPYGDLTRFVERKFLR